MDMRKRTFLLFALLLSCTIRTLTAQNTVRETTQAINSNYDPLKKSVLDTVNNVVSNGYYSWKVTGETETDAKNARTAYEKFKKENRALYEKITTDTSKVKVYVSDFNKMQMEQQEYILSRPDFYEIINE